MSRLLFVSTPVGPLGSGLGGGVELTLHNLVKEMQHRGHNVLVLAPEGSQLTGVEIKEIKGNWQIPAQNQQPNSPISFPANSVLANSWDYAYEIQPSYDLIVNFAFDWLPLYLTKFFTKPIAHFISMGSLSFALDQAITEVASTHPGSLGLYTQAQAATFPDPEVFQVLGSAVELDLYQFCPHPDFALAWVGRIAPEKGLEDAVALADLTQIPLRIFGKIQDPIYWQKVQTDYPQAPVEYLGFLTTAELQSQLGKCLALIMTPRWVEAFGNVAIEALACGVPVISYCRGGPAEIIREGETGFLVEPDLVDGLVKAVSRLSEIDRRACRQQAIEQYSVSPWGDRFEGWFEAILTRIKS